MFCEWVSHRIYLRTRIVCGTAMIAGIGLFKRSPSQRRAGRMISIPIPLPIPTPTQWAPGMPAVLGIGVEKHIFIVVTPMGPDRRRLIFHVFIQVVVRIGGEGVFGLIVFDGLRWTRRSGDHAGFAELEEIVDRDDRGEDEEQTGNVMLATILVGVARRYKIRTPMYMVALLILHLLSDPCTNAAQPLLSLSGLMPPLVHAATAMKAANQRIVNTKSTIANAYGFANFFVFSNEGTALR